MLRKTVGAHVGQPAVDIICDDFGGLSIGR